MALFDIPDEPVVVQKKEPQIKLKKGQTIDSLNATARILVLEKLSKYKDVSNKIKALETELKDIEKEESKEKRASLDTEQLIKMSHIFREKYLNIPIPESFS